MNLQECYEALGGDFEDVLSRLRSEKLVQKFVLKFLNDKSFDLLCSSLEEENYEEAFRASHTIKGVLPEFELYQIIRIQPCADRGPPIRMEPGGGRSHRASEIGL